MRTLAGSLVFAALVAACGTETPPGADPGPDGPDGGAEDPDARVEPRPDPSPLFERDRILEVEIEIAPGDWDSLRTQTRTFEDLFGGECLAEPFGSPFTYFEAAVTVEGERFEQVGVRKKGLLGSLSETKPSLKLDFAEFVTDREILGLKKLTLNNSVSDPSYLRQCLTYDLFADAGIAAPRCNFAHVSVNGNDLGLYVHLESVGHDFLERAFGDDGGNLYEGTLSDFRPQWVGTFERKTNEADPNRSDLDDMVRALQAPDDELLAALEPRIDVDRFLTYWAMEMLTAHHDGYASNTNNFFVYVRPKSGKMEFFPWGVDATMVPGNPFGGAFASVSATAILPRRLYQMDETRGRYLDRLGELLDTVWDEDAILDEIDALEELVAPLADPDGTGVHADSVDGVRDFVLGQRPAIEAELASPPVWEAPLREPPCFTDVGSAVGDFETTWGTLDDQDPLGSGTATLDATVDGALYPVQIAGSSAGWDTGGSGRAILAVVALLDDGMVLIAYFSIDPALLVPGARIDLSITSTMGVLAHLDPATNESTNLGIVNGGTLVLDEAGTREGARIRGHFEGDLIDFPWF